MVLDEFLDVANVKWSRNLKSALKNFQYIVFDENCIRHAIYRPFAKMLHYFQNIAVDEAGQFRKFFPTPIAESENQVICLPTVGFRDAWSVMLTHEITDLHFSSGDGNQCFPFYTYDEDGTNRRENITDWALGRFREHYGDPTIGKWDIFHYVYGVLHHPQYRAAFAGNLKLELPRIPLLEGFRAVADVGRQLADLHVHYERVEPWPLTWVYAEGVPLSYRVEAMRLSRDKTTLVVNDSLSLAGLPPEAFDYVLGNRSALEWVIDQHRVKPGKPGEPASDPNRPDDPEALVRLVERVVRVSVETVRLIRSLPDPGLGPQSVPTSAPATA